jgi:hypothetical protein
MLLKCVRLSMLCVVSFQSVVADSETNKPLRLAGAGGEISGEETLELLKGAQGRFRNEFLPVEKDAGGNWGKATNDLMVSVRTSGDTFTNGQPVVLVILLRNTGQEQFQIPDASWMNYLYELRLLRDGQIVEPAIPRKKPDPADGSAWSFPIQTCSQRRDDVRLDKIFDLSRVGNYEITAERAVNVAGKQPGVTVCSGIAKFQIRAPAEESRK